MRLPGTFIRSSSRLAVGLTLALPSLLAAQAAAPSPAPATAPVTLSKDSPRPVAHAVQRRDPIAIDGRLDDAGWAAAEPITQFYQQAPDEGQAPSERTELRILYDASAVYVSARMFDSKGPSAVRKLLVRRDQLLYDNASDKIALILDPYHDRTTRVWFELNPLGVKGDHLNGDPSYDPVWEGAANIDSLGWTAEFRIPLSQLRFPRDSVQTWGLQVYRILARRNEADMWAFWKLNEFGGAAYFGTLEGLALAAQPRQLELLPYAVSKSKFSLPTPGDPFRNKQEMTSRVGGDLRYNITSNFTLDAKGMVWFTGNTNGRILKMDPATGKVTTFLMPDSTVRDPHTMTFDRKGDAWFTAQGAGAVGRLSGADGKIRLWRMEKGSRPYGIWVDSHDRPWFDLFGTNKIGMIDPSSGEFKAYTLPNDRSRPRRIAITKDDVVWYGDYTRGYLGRLDPKTGATEEYLLPSGIGSLPYAMTTDDRGRIWLAETGIQPNRLVAFDPAKKAFTENVPIAADGNNTIRHMTFDKATRQIWFGGDANMIGRVKVSAEPLVP